MQFISLKSFIKNRSQLEIRMPIQKKKQRKEKSKDKNAKIILKIINIYFLVILLASKIEKNGHKS